MRIAHSTIDENGHARGGKAGDQNGKEVCIRNYYSKTWGFLIRAKDSALAEKIAHNAEVGANNDAIGYNRDDRNSMHTEAKKVAYQLDKIKTPCNSDCSAFVTCVCIASGVDELEYSNNAPVTATMEKAFKKTGKFDILKESKYLTKPDYLRRGDILVKESNHTIIILDDGSMVYDAPSEDGYYPKYTGAATKIDDVFKAIGVPASMRGNYKSRMPIAVANGIDNYVGATGQNNALVSLAKNGKLHK